MIGTLDPPLSESIQTALKSARKISTLYTHQASAIRAITEGKHTIVSTSTASGKSVIYQVPVLRFLEEDPHATAIFIYPTKVDCLLAANVTLKFMCTTSGIGPGPKSSYGEPYMLLSRTRAFEGKAESKISTHSHLSIHRLPLTMETLLKNFVQV